MSPSKKSSTKHGTVRHLRVVLGDQLSHSLASLDEMDSEQDVVLMMEVADETSYVQHHPQKIILILSAMRHFAQTLEEKGICVRYIRLDDEENTGSFTRELRRACEELSPERVIATHPGEYRVLKAMEQWEHLTGVPVDILPDDRFFCSLDAFAEWAAGRKELRMELFYRELRQRTGLLMQEEDGSAKPEGGRWNFDKENRKKLPKSLSVDEPLRFESDAITREVMDLVKERFSDHFGAPEPFNWAVTREDALKALDYFIDHALANFGDYQDAMARGEPFLFHSLLSPYLNCGLLEPREVCEAAEQAYHEGDAPLNAVEGFIRQILGWREYVRGLYWLKMPDYAGTNHFDATRSLPDFYWTGETDMACLKAVITQTRDHAYAHHIQRLMVTGNFALLMGALPEDVCRWYLEVFIDAYEWVELPNTHGMALFADGGVMASKPYAASGSYINRMSDYCKECRYKVKEVIAEDACPFNYLYWDFIMRHEAELKHNHRMGYMLATLGKFSVEKRERIGKLAEEFCQKL